MRFLIALAVLAIVCQLSYAEDKETVLQNKHGLARPVRNRPEGPAGTVVEGGQEPNQFRAGQRRRNNNNIFDDLYQDELPRRNGPSNTNRNNRRRLGRRRPLGLGLGYGLGYGLGLGYGGLGYGYGGLGGLGAYGGFGGLGGLGGFYG